MSGDTYILYTHTQKKVMLFHDLFCLMSYTLHSMLTAKNVLYHTSSVQFNILRSTVAVSGGLRYLIPLIQQSIGISVTSPCCMLLFS